jgi:hypothetical protein
MNLLSRTGQELADTKENSVQARAWRQSIGRPVLRTMRIPNSRLAGVAPQAVSDKTP